MPEACAIFLSAAGITRKENLLTAVGVIVSLRAEMMILTVVQVLSVVVTD